MIDFRHTINYNDNLITSVMCTLRRFINRNRTAQCIEKRHTKRTEAQPRRMTEADDFWKRVEPEGVSHASVNNYSIALWQAMNNLHRILYNLNCLYKERVRPPIFCVCQLGHWAFPRRPPLAVKRHRPSRESDLGSNPSSAFGHQWLWQR